MKLTPRFLIRYSLEQVYGDPAKLDEELITRYHRMLLREGNRQALFRALAQRRSTAGSNARRPRLADVHQPTLILWGRDDRWIPPAHAESFRDALPDSELILYTGVGHVPMEEIPERTARDAAHFLERRGFGRTKPEGPSPGLQAASRGAG